MSHRRGRGFRIRNAAVSASARVRHAHAACAGQLPAQRWIARHPAQPSSSTLQDRRCARCSPERSCPDEHASLVVTQRSSAMLICEPKPAARRNAYSTGIAATLGQIQRAQLRIDFLEIRHRRHASGFECLHGDYIFDAGAHRMTGEALGVGNHDAIGVFAEDVTQGIDLRRGAAAARRRVGFMGHEDRMRRDLPAGDAMRSPPGDTRFSIRPPMC